MTAAITAAQDSAWPPRMIVEATGLTIGNVVTLYRVQSGARTAVRGAVGVTLSDTSLVVDDGEYPFGVPITYVVNANGADVATSSVITPTLPGGKVALSDAITGLAVEAVITAWPNKTSTRSASRFVVGGRTVVVSSPRGSAESTVEFLTETEIQREQFLALLTGATSNIILVRQSGDVGDGKTYEDVDGWYYVLSDDRTRYVQRGSDKRRLWTLDLIDSDGWAPDLAASGWTYADVTTVYSGQTYADLTSDFGTYLDVAVFDWGSLL